MSNVYSRRDVTPSFIIEAKTSDRRDGSPVITFSTSQPSYHTLPTEMNLRRYTKTSSSNDTNNNNFEYNTLPHVASTDVYILPEGSADRNTITLTRRRGSDETHIVSHQPFREPVFKTTMITQVKPRNVDYGFDQQQHQYTQQQPQIQLSVRQSPPPSVQQQQHYAFQRPQPQQLQDQSQHQSYVIYHHGANQPSNSYQQQQQQQQQQRFYEQQPQYISTYEPQQERQQQHYSYQQQQQLPQPSYVYHVSATQQQPATLPQAAPSRLVYSSQPTNQAIARSKPLNQSGSSPTSPQNVIGSFEKIDEDRKNVLVLDKQLLDKKPLQVKLGLGDVDGKKCDTNESKEAEVDELTNLLMHSMQMSGDPDFLGMCTKCGRSVMGSTNGCTVLNQLYHRSCFTCCKCGIGLKNVPFYSADGQSFCERCHLMSLPKCDTCLKPIADKVLTAVGRNYHPDCFCCVVCNCSLDSTPFTVDNNNQPHCIEDFQKKYSPRCDGCNGLIVPDENSGKATRVTILNKNFHVACYKCQDCKVLLTPVTMSSSTTSTNNNSADNNARCFPLDDMLLCQKCHVNRINKLTNKANTDV